MHEDTDPAETVFRDIMSILSIGFLAVVILLLPFINPPTETTAASTPPGNVIITADWPDGWHTDIDLWVRAPGEIPVGYSNKDGPTFNLLRDDLGSLNDITDSNREQVVGRGIPPGLYVINVHAYKTDPAHPETPVSIEINVVRPNGKVALIFEGKVTLTHNGQELTVVRFRLDKNGFILPGSRNTIPTPLRVAP